MVINRGARLVVNPAIVAPAPPILDLAGPDRENEHFEELLERIEANDPILTELPFHNANSPLYKYALSPRDFYRIFCALLTNHHITDVNLAYNVDDERSENDVAEGSYDIDVRSIRAFALLMQLNATITSLNISGRFFVESPNPFLLAISANISLKTLAISNIDLTDDELKHFIIPKQLHTLNIGGVKIGGNLLKALADTLVDNESQLEVLDLSMAEMAAENLTPANITYVSTILQSLKHNRTLRHLDLTENNFSPFARHVAAAIAENKGLTHLFLDGNQITDVEAHQLSNALRTNTTLQTLSLGGNAISHEGFTAILRGLHNNKSLTHLVMSWNPLYSSEDLITELAEFVKYNHTLAQIDLKHLPPTTQVEVNAILAFSQTLAEPEQPAKRQRLDMGSSSG